jgi:hypothetical protein
MALQPTHLLRRILLCPLGLHLRSRKHAVSDGFHWRSTCVYCDRPLIKVSDGRWRGDRAAAAGDGAAAD